MGLAKHVHFVGRIEDNVLPEYYRLADVFVLPAINQAEAFGMVLLEAMSAGRSIITTNVPGCRDLVKWKNGVIVEPKDPVGLASAIKELAIDHDKTGYLCKSNDIIDMTGKLKYLISLFIIMGPFCFYK